MTLERQKESIGAKDGDANGNRRGSLISSRAQLRVPGLVEVLPSLENDCGRRVALLERRDLLLHGIVGQAIALLKPASQFFALTVDHVEVILGELAPFLLDPALELLPITFEYVFVHVDCFPFAGRSLEARNAGGVT